VTVGPLELNAVPSPRGHQLTFAAAAARQADGGFMEMLRPQGSRWHGTLYNLVSAGNRCSTSAGGGQPRAVRTLTGGAEHQQSQLQGDWRADLGYREEQARWTLGFVTAF
jgi:hypothetical protein